MKYVLSLMILFCYSAVLAQYSGTSGVRSTSYYYGEGNNNSGAQVEAGDQTNNQDNDFIYNDNRKTDHNTTNHHTTNVIEAREGERNLAWEACASQYRNKSGKRMKACLDNYNRSLNKYSDYEFESEIIAICNECSGDPEWHPRCSHSCTSTGAPTPEAMAEYSEKDACEHSDRACNEAEKGKLQAKLDKKGGHYCPECEKAKAELGIAKVNAKRDVRIAKQQAKAAKHKYKERNNGFWNAIGTVATATAGVLAPLLVEKERTKQITSCHNSYANSGADVVRENRLAWQQQLHAEERNFLPLSSWEYQSAADNHSFLCNGGFSNQFAGPLSGGAGQFGLSGFSPFGQPGGNFGLNGPGGNYGYGPGSGFGNPFGSVFSGLGNTISGMIPNINFGLNANANVSAGGTAWTGQPNPYYGTNPNSPFPNGSGNNSVFNQGFGNGFGNNNGFQQPGGGGGNMPFAF